MATMQVISEILRRGKRPLTREQALADLKVRLLGGGFLKSDAAQ